MDWLTATLLSAFAFSVVNVIDSHLLSRRMPGLNVFLLSVTIVFLPFTIVAMVFNPLPSGLTATPLLLAIGSGILRATGIILFLYVLRTEEVSRAVPITYIQPVAVALMAVVLLGESLALLQWLAVFIVVTGAVLVSLQHSDDSLKRRSQPLLLLILFSLLMAVSDVMSKYSLDYINFWQMYWINGLCTVLAILVVAIRQKALKQLPIILRESRLTMLIVANETLAFGAVLLFFWAVENGQVSLVAAVYATRPLFVLLLVYTLGRLWPKLLLEGRLLRGKLALRGLAVVMIVIGVGIIYLYQ